MEGEGSEGHGEQAPQPQAGQQAAARKRAANFTSQEIETLVRGVQARHSILTGGSEVRPRQRTDAWKEIAAEVSSLGYANRTWQSVQHRFQDCRIDIKKKMANEANAARGTGGGPPETFTYPGWEATVRDMIQPAAVVGLPSLVDSGRSESLQLPARRPLPPQVPATCQDAGPPATTSPAAGPSYASPPGPSTRCHPLSPARIMAPPGSQAMWSGQMWGPPMWSHPSWAHSIDPKTMVPWIIGPRQGMWPPQAQPATLAPQAPQDQQAQPATLAPQAQQAQPPTLAPQAQQAQPATLAPHDQQAQPATPAPQAPQDHQATPVRQDTPLSSASTQWSGLLPVSPALSAAQCQDFLAHLQHEREQNQQFMLEMRRHDARKLEEKRRTNDRNFEERRLHNERMFQELTRHNERMFQEVRRHNLSMEEYARRAEMAREGQPQDRATPSTSPPSTSQTLSPASRPEEPPTIRRGRGRPRGTCSKGQESQETHKRKRK